MSKTKRSHHRSEEQKMADSNDQHSELSNASDEAGQIAEHKRRHRKKASKKSKKHRSKKRSPSPSDNDSSSNSEASSSDEEEQVKRKKQKKHKKSKRRSRASASEHEDDVKVLAEPAKVHYVSSGDERQRVERHARRPDERMRPREPLNEVRREYKSKWDSPAAELERKREHRGEERGFREAGRPDGHRERARQTPPLPVRAPPRHPEERDRFERRHDEPEYRHRDQSAGHRQADPKNDSAAGYRRNEPHRERSPDFERKTRFEDARGTGRHAAERNRSISPRRDANRGRANDRERDNHRPPNFGDRSPRSHERPRSDLAQRPSERFAKQERPHERPSRNDGYRGERPDERPARGEPPRREYNERRRSRSPRARSRSPKQRSRSPKQRGGPKGGRSPDGHQVSRPNPFRRNRDEERSDFRQDEERPYRNDEGEPQRDRREPDAPPSDRHERGERSERAERQEPVERSERAERIERGDRVDRKERVERSDAPERNSRPAEPMIRKDRPSRFNRKRPGAGSDNEEYEWGKPSDKPAAAAADEEPAADKEKPNFGLSGKLTEDANKVNGVILKYAEPQEARRPKRRWRLYPFKGDEALQTLHIHRQSCYLIGRDKKICDIPVDHPSCSKQHAVLQFRLVPYKRSDGSGGQRVRPYVLDLESSNHTYLNNNAIEPKKYFELMEKDVLKFGYSTREYVLLHEDSHVDEEFDENDYEQVHIKEED